MCEAHQHGVCVAGRMARFFFCKCAWTTRHVYLRTRYQLTRVALRSLRRMASRALGVGCPPSVYGCPDFLTRYLRTPGIYMCVISLQHAARRVVTAPCPAPLFAAIFTRFGLPQIIKSPVAS